MSARRPTGWVGAIELVLGHVVTRIVLSVAIVISLIPHDWMHANDVWFLLLFGPEFVLRVIVACRKEGEDGTPDPIEGVGWRAPRSSDLWLLLVDLVANISFLPLGAAQGARWLRLFRLTRTVMLLRYWAPLVRDMWAVVRRRERARQLSLMGVIVIVTAFAGAVVLNHATDEVGEDFDGDGDVGDEHDHAFWVRMYWALRQIEDPGNMLSSPHEFATLAVSVALTVAGLFLVSFLIGVGGDIVTELMMLSRLRASGLKRHTVLINLSNGTRQLLYEVMAEYRKLIPEGLRPLTPRWFRELRKNARQQREFVVVGQSGEPPEFLREPEFARIIYRENTDEDDEAFLTRADVPAARRVVVLADIHSETPDDETVRTLITIVERLREAGAKDEEAQTTLIAEILDESNIGAAAKAITRASARVDAHLIPTERILSLFMAAVARRRGLFPLLTELLASTGHELYSYDYRRAEASTGQVPKMPVPAARALESIYWRGLARPADRRVLTLGILMAHKDGSPHARVAINPSEDDIDRETDEVFTGFVAFAPNLRVTGEFADEVLERPDLEQPPLPTGGFQLPRLVVSQPTPIRRVLICGFRPATVNLIEALCFADPQAQIVVLVQDALAKAKALDDFDGYSNLVRTDLLGGMRKTFSWDEQAGYLSCDPSHGGPQPAARIWIEVGDWTSTRRLMRLPRGLGTAPEMDAIIMISSERQGSDAATATALMKLEHLQDHFTKQTGSASTQTIVAEVINAELAHRLTRRYEEMGRDNVTVFSIHELRAFFMFQSVVVPSFTRLYGELLAPWGQSFARLRVAGDRSGSCTFSELAARLHAEGRMPVAVEMATASGRTRIWIAQGDPDDDDRIDLALLRAVWVVRQDNPATSTARYSAVRDDADPTYAAPG